MHFTIDHIRYYGIWGFKKNTNKSNTFIYYFIYLSLKRALLKLEKKSFFLPAKRFFGSQDIQVLEY